MEPSRKVLIIDKSIDRKNKIAALKSRGFSVFPALHLAEARSRCRPGAYDLIIVNAQDESEAAMAFCDSLGERTPSQPVLLMISGGSHLPERDYLIADDPQALADRVEAMLGSSASTEPGPGNREDESARAIA
jgi:DNA-binding response OmpR family regulator